MAAEDMSSRKIEPAELPAKQQSIVCVNTIHRRGEGNSILKHIFPIKDNFIKYFIAAKKFIPLPDCTSKMAKVLSNEQEAMRIEERTEFRTAVS